MRTSAGDSVDLLDSPIAHRMRLALKALRAMILGVDASFKLTCATHESSSRCFWAAARADA